jgi:hypothetical protein
MKTKATRRIDSNTQSVGEVLRKPFFYRVPANQRDFAWTLEEIDVLWEDVTSALEDDRNEYFLGAIVLSQCDDEKLREIVDGQQRLAALSMMFAALVSEWKESKDDKRALGVFRDYLGTEDRRTADVLPKLRLNELNDPVFQSLVLKSESVAASTRKGWRHSNKLLEAAFIQIKEKLKLWLTKFDNTEAALIDLEEFLSNKTNLIIIEVGDESDAFVIFETLNDRGLELAVSDLVKNYLFSLAGNHLESFKRTWTEVSLLVGSETLTSFLRHYWLSQHSLVRERELYRTLRSNVKSATTGRQFMERIRKVADYYAALMNPEHAYWSDFPAETRQYLDALLLFKVTQFRPVMLAAMEIQDPNEVSKLLKMLMVISFRYTVVSALGTGNLEKVYTDTALAIRKGQAKGLKSIFGLLKPAYVDDSKFEDDFATKAFTKAGVTRYALAQLNDLIESDPEKMVAESSGRITLEHVLPRNPGRDWVGAIPKDEDAEDYINLIGNLTLLEKGRNRGIAAANFNEKKSKAFGQSTLALNKQIVGFSSWTSKEIRARSQSLAKSAKQIWRVDY